MNAGNTARQHDEDPLLLEAAEWFERLQHESLEGDSLAAWQRWLAQSPAHKQAFDEYLRLWERLDEVPCPSIPTQAELAADRYAGDGSVAAWRSMRRTRWQPALLGVVAAAFACIVVGAGAWYVRLTSDVSTAMFETRASEHRDVSLPDGSTLSLGARSRVWIHFKPERRDLVLDRGEAFFRVAKDASRPFVVQAGDTTITAVGTAFNVRRSEERIVVAVTEGAVAIEPHGDADATGTLIEAQPLRAGQGVTIGPDSKNGPLPVREVSQESALAWRTGRLEYLNEPLRQVIADVNRYSALPIVIANPDLGDLRIGGTVFENDVEGWLQSLEEFLPVAVQREERRIVLISRERRSTPTHAPAAVP